MNTNETKKIEKAIEEFCNEELRSIINLTDPEVPVDEYDLLNRMWSLIMDRFDFSGCLEYIDCEGIKSDRAFKNVVGSACRRIIEGPFLDRIYKELGISFDEEEEDLEELREEICGANK